ncbi:MAG: protein kinase [Planctomyces sp.]|nr:protein kinase [Planctomyces sp.]
MHFRCPNCHQPVHIPDRLDLKDDDKTLDAVTCPSCNSQFSLAENSATTASMEPGRQVGQFVLEQVLGEGTYGTVYKAWDTELLRHVALKLPRTGAVTADQRLQFLREARMAAKITNPHVVTVFEVGKFDDSFYIASQYIDGVTLRERLQMRPMTEREAAEFLIPLLRAIEVFHNQGIIHRDLKPGNILIGSDGTPLIADFGLARRDQAGETTVTQTGKVVGTIPYMSPEQARGDNKHLTNRTDIFAMGVILFELLTGHRPFVATNSRTVLYRIITEDPPSPRSLKRSIPRDLETICLKALRKDPLQRYESAAAMADDLQNFLDGKPILARPVSVPEQCWKLIRRNRVSFAATLVTVAAVVSAIMMMVRPPAGTVPVVIATENGDASLRFVRYNDVLRVPHESGFQAISNSGQRVYVTPGLYRIEGRDEAGRFHEVWRTIPELPSSGEGDPYYPHRAWSVKDGVVMLQPFRLFADQDVAESMVNVKGGQFEAGIENDTAMARRHPQTVGDFEAGVNEVSYEVFRKVLNQPFKLSTLTGTYLSEINSRFGDRSMISDDTPVSGYPIDVAILYCELAGGRLPTCIEWEYLATLGGSAPYSTGNTPPIEQPENWSILSIKAVTSDTTPSGIRNLCSSVAEYTDSPGLSYVLLFPTRFPEDRRSHAGAEELARIPTLIEVRGAPSDWLASGVAAQFVNPRQRLLAPFPAADIDALTTYSRIGWRMVRAVD